MSDITAVRNDKRQTGDIYAVDLAAVAVFAGGLLTFNTSGYAEPANASQAVAGVAIESVDNSAGSAGDKTVRVYRNGIFSFDAAGLTQADTGKEVFVGANDNTVVVGGTGAGRIPVGRIVEVVSATEARVQLNVFGTATAA